METDRKDKDDDCVFCKIATGELPMYKVYETENVIAMLTIEPVREGHTIVIPKEHYQYAEDMPDELYTEMMLVVKKLKSKFNKIFGSKHTGIFISGWDVPHTHTHVLPMHDSKDITSKPLLDHTAPQFTTDGFAKTAERITQAL